jgi:hypothetical protein
MVDVAGFEKGFAGNATDSQAGATELRVVVDAGSIHSELGSANRRDIATGASTEYNYIVFLDFHESKPLISCWAGLFGIF